MVKKPEDLSLIFSTTQQLRTICKFGSRGSNTLFWSHKDQAYTWWTNIHSYKTLLHTHIQFKNNDITRAGVVFINQTVSEDCNHQEPVIGTRIQHWTENIICSTWESASWVLAVTVNLSPSSVLEQKSV